MIYLDYAAATPVDPEVLAAMRPYFSEKFFNPSATNLASQAVKKDIDEARASIAQNLGCRPAEVIFTAGATEANNLAIQGIMREHPDGEVLISAIEHESVIEPARLFENREIPVTPKGIINLPALEKMISDRTILVSVMYVNNELGTIQPLAEIAELINKIRRERLNSGNKTPLYLHADAAQAGNFLSLHVARLGVDMMSINGGKIYGPKQSGTLHVKAGTKLAPLIEGGGQEFGLRSGTENVPAIIGLAKALDKAQAMKSGEVKRLMPLRQDFEKKLLTEFPNAIINGSVRTRAPHIVSVTLPGTDNERLMMRLDELGIVCAVGSACSASSGEASHVLAGIGLDEEQARSTLRFSFGRQTINEDLTKTVGALKSLTG